MVATTDVLGNVDCIVELPGSGFDGEVAPAVIHLTGSTELAHPPGPSPAAVVAHGVDERHDRRDDPRGTGP